MKQKTVWFTDYKELEELITKTYGRDYEILASEEMGSSQYAAYWNTTVEDKPLEDYEIDDLQVWKDTGKGQFIVSTILQDMCLRKIIPEGEYAVGINW